MRAIRRFLASALVLLSLEGCMPRSYFLIGDYRTEKGVYGKIMDEAGRRTPVKLGENPRDRFKRIDNEAGYLCRFINKNGDNYIERKELKYLPR